MNFDLKTISILGVILIGLSPCIAIIGVFFFVCNMLTEIFKIFFSLFRKKRKTKKKEPSTQKHVHPFIKQLMKSKPQTNVTF
jgi:hypothetical protein